MFADEEEAQRRGSAGRMGAALDPAQEMAMDRPVANAARAGNGDAEAVAGRVARALGRETFWSRASAVGIVGIFLIVLIAAVEMARPVLLPVVSAFVIGMMLGPVSRRAAQIGIPTAVSAIALLLVVVVVFYGIIMLISAPVVSWVNKAPDIGRSLMEKLQVLERPLAALSDLRNVLAPGQQGGFQLDLMGLVRPAVGLVTPAVTQLLIFFATLFFYLLGQTQVRRGLVGAFEGREARLTTLRILNEIERNLTRYLSLVTVINFAVGICAGIIAYVVGLPSPLAWAGLAFIINFIPYIGALIMELSMFAVGVVSFETVTHALIAPLLYVTMAVVEGQFITPSIIGQRFLLNPIVVFLSLVFWTWLWGPFGAFLAVPILIIMMVAESHLFPKVEAALPD